MSAFVEPAADLVGNRRELKLHLDLAKARAFAEVVRAHLPLHRYEGPGASGLPGARHFITTVYFDTPDRRVLARVRSGQDGVRIRARAYYDEFPALTAHARSRQQVFRHSPEVWLEIKHTEVGRSAKWRVAIPKREVPTLLAGQLSAAAVDRLPVHGEGPRAEAQRQLRAAVMHYEGRLRASVIVNYRRTAWQDPAGTLRITADQDLAFFPAPADMWSQELNLERACLGQPLEGFSGCLIEVKATGPLPPWLPPTLADLPLAPSGFSKFVAAGEAAARA